MKQNRLNLYLIDMKYIRDLAKADDHVMSVSPQIYHIKQLHMIGRIYTSAMRGFADPKLVRLLRRRQQVKQGK